MFSQTPSNKFLVLSPTESGPDSSINTSSNPSSLPISRSASVSTNTTNTTLTEYSFTTSESGSDNPFLYLGYDVPLKNTSPQQQPPTPNPNPNLGMHVCLPLTAPTEHIPDTIPSGGSPDTEIHHHVPERFQTRPLFLNFGV